MFREDLAWEMISRTIAGDDKGLTPLEKKQYDRQRASYLKDIAEGHENAPSEGCKRYLRMNFCYSKAPEVKDYAKEMVKIKETLGKEDFEHLIKYCGNNRMRYEYRKLIKRLEGDFEED